MMNNNLYVTYRRVSTKRQGKSGLGLADQKAVIENHLKIQNAESYVDFEEHESGTFGSSRDILDEALALCEKTGYPLMVARLDRLSRSVAFIAALLETNIKVYFCDAPTKDKIAIYFAAIMAQSEAEKIKLNVKRGIQQRLKRIEEEIADLEADVKKFNATKNFKKVGELKQKIKKLKWGNPQCFTDEGRQKGANKMREKAFKNENNIKAYAVIKERVQAGDSYQKIADGLNMYGFRTSTGGKFHKKAVQRIYTLFTSKASA